MVLSLAACGKVEITMQDIYEASRTEALLKNHESVYVQNKNDGVPYSESYLAQDYIYHYYGEEASDWSEFLTDDAYYDYFDGDYARVFPVSPDGVRDIASYRAEYYDSLLLAPDTVYETIESVSEKDGHITVVSFFDQQALENKVIEGLTVCHCEYVLDAKNFEIISYSGDIAYDNGIAYHMASEVSYDAEAPERINVFLEYANQTEDLRNITVVSNPDTEKEISQSFRAPKGLLVAFTSAGNFEATFEVYTDAACTELYDPYTDTDIDTDSDLTIYVKWDEQAQ
jgi:hypothetical protein